MKTIYLQIFLGFDIFLVGVFASNAIRHAYAHFRPHAATPDDRLNIQHNPAKPGQLPAALREHLLEVAQADFQHVLKSASEEFQKDLDYTSDHINKQIEKMGNETVSNQIEQYLVKLATLQKQTEDQLLGANDELTKYQAELRQKVTEEVAAEKQTLVKQLDTKVADAVQSFLLEAMQHNVDLGAQSAYLTKMLEDHKSELIKGISDEN